MGGDRARWTTREIVVGAVLGVAVGVIFWAWGLLWSTAFQAVPFPVSYVVVGLWMMGGLLVPYVVRRPGAALLGELVAAFVSMLLGNQWGLATMLSGLVQGVGAELVFGAFRWRRYSLPVMLGAGALAGVSSILLDSYFYGYWQAYTGTGHRGGRGPGGRQWGAAGRARFETSGRCTGAHRGAGRARHLPGPASRVTCGFGRIHLRPHLHVRGEGRTGAPRR